MKPLFEQPVEQAFADDLRVAAAMLSEQGEKVFFAEISDELGALIKGCDSNYSLRDCIDTMAEVAERKLLTNPDQISIEDVNERLAEREREHQIERLRKSR